MKVQVLRGFLAVSMAPVLLLNHHLVLNVIMSDDTATVRILAVAIAINIDKRIIATVIDGLTMVSLFMMPSLTY